jgi:hypothetical protein
MSRIKRKENRRWKKEDKDLRDVQLNARIEIYGCVVVGVGLKPAPTKSKSCQ